MSAVLERERRATAGKRMTSLVGEAQQQDDEFWGHDTWQEDSESYHSSSEEEEKDEFDSDFDESESDNDEEELEQGASEERQLQLEIKNQKKRSSAYVETARALHKPKKKLKGKQLVTGDGLNAGIVLNLPSTAAPLPPLPAQHTALQVPSVSVSLAKTPVVLPSPAQSFGVKKNSAVKSSSTAMATRERRATASRSKSALVKQSLATADEKSSDNIRATAEDDMVDAAHVAKKRNASQTHRFTQEELLLEAANVTESENAKWLLARKRHQEDMQEFHKEQAAASSRLGSSQIVSSYSSKRGQLNVVKFFDMDSVPDIFKSHLLPVAPEVHLCAITGKPARYKDPKTMLYYSDVDAFKELRRKMEAGEIPVHRLKSVPTQESASRQSTDDKLEATPTVSMNGSNVEGVCPPKAKKDASRIGGEQKPLRKKKAKTAASSDGLLATFDPNVTKGLNSASLLKPASSSFKEASLSVPSGKTQATVCPTLEPILLVQSISHNGSHNAIMDTDTHQTVHFSATSAVVGTPLSPSSEQSSHHSDDADLALAGSQRSVASNSSSGSRRASPRRRKPSNKILQNIEDTGATGIPFLGDADTSSNGDGGV